MFSKLAEELKIAREKSQITPEFIAQKIKIDLKFLHLMEKGDYSFLPEIYIKAFLREYARIVGLDEQLILKKYELAKEGKDYSVTTDLSEVKLQSVNTTDEVKETQKPVPKKTTIIDDYDRSGSDSRTKNNNQKNLVLVVTSGAVIITLFLVYMFVFYDSTDKIIAEKSYEEVLRESKKRFEEEPVKVENSSLTSDSLLLAFRAFDSSWLKVTFDENETKEYYLYPKNTLEIKAGESFNLTIGNSFGVEVYLNGEKIDIKGKSSAVSRVIIDRDGIKPVSI
ncbi:MAG TPA: helix-turn-helix domain-containing protein, partial [Ignavibacteriaceae bacterium]|nr:helix-turn-helix domain-containing protein [Ignavibacteriaceae bacterium]